MQAVLVLKYVVPDYGFPALYFGIANVVSNGLIMLRLVPCPVCIERASDADFAVARWSSGFHRTWKMTIPTIWPFDMFCTSLLYVYQAAGLGAWGAGNVKETFTRKFEHIFSSTKPLWFLLLFFLIRHFLEPFS